MRHGADQGMEACLDLRYAADIEFSRAELEGLIDAADRDGSRALIGPDSPMQLGVAE